MDRIALEAAQINELNLLLVEQAKCDATEVIVDAGTESAGGGGNGSDSAIKAVTKEIREHLVPEAGTFLGRTKLTPPSGTSVKDPKVLAALEVMFKDDLLGSKALLLIDTIWANDSAALFDIKEDAPCFDPKTGAPKDASTPFKPGATICISAQRLSRYPESALRSELIGVLFHELTHQYGFEDEDTAERVQEYVKARYLSSQAIARIKELRPELRKSSSISPEQHALRACYQMGLILAELRKLPVSSPVRLGADDKQAASLQSSLRVVTDLSQPVNPREILEYSVQQACGGSLGPQVSEALTGSWRYVLDQSLENL